MQGYQSYAALQGRYYPCALNLCLIERLRFVGTGLAPVRLRSLIVPGSPGHVRFLHPYPPSRRRRR